MEEKKNLENKAEKTSDLDLKKAKGLSRKEFEANRKRANGRKAGSKPSAFGDGKPE